MLQRRRYCGPLALPLSTGSRRKLERSQRAEVPPTGSHAFDQIAERAGVEPRFIFRTRCGGAVPPHSCFLSGAPLSRRGFHFTGKSSRTAPSRAATITSHKQRAPSGGTRLGLNKVGPRGKGWGLSWGARLPRLPHSRCEHAILAPATERRD
jgi:hypothetical protein